MSAPEFSEFFEAVHDNPPFPWQARLAERVVQEGWPSLLDLPTGSGKTSVLDIALYALAVAPEISPRRIFLVVDRRIVVDQGAIHARKILGRLRDGAAPAIVERLLNLFEPAPWEKDPDPFHVAILRGGMPREDEWAKRPDQPVLGVSTVDQVGSRLLFRGYGVGDRMASVHAGLLGNDALFLLDEVHLAQPFAETLGAISKRWRKGLLADRFTFVRMSATPQTQEPSTFGLAAADRSHPGLAKRLKAKKRARLIEVKVSGDEGSRRAHFAAACTKEVRGFLDQGAKVIGVVVNRVETARGIWRQIEDEAGRTFDAVLLTGRMRPLDRDVVLEGEDGVLARVGAAKSREERPCPRPLVLVATQCIEAGADLDLDALVTECASLDALRQRFGRLDRMGDIGDSQAVVLLRGDQVNPKTDDPVYGSSLPGTWNWLRSKGDKVGFGIDEMDRLRATAGEAWEALMPEAKRAPVLLPAHLDSWVQTSPRPFPDPEVALWLHGPDSGAPDVQLVWRADLGEVELTAAAGEGTEAKRRRGDLMAQLSACRPSSLEALSIPIYAARAWLWAVPAPAVDDFINRAGKDDAQGDARGLPALRWSGDKSKVVYAADLRPGDTLVVPASRGGLRAYNWDPDAPDDVIDLGDLAQLKGRGRATLRTHPEVLKVWGLDEEARKRAPMLSDDDALDEEQQITDWLEGLPEEAPEGGREEWKGLRMALLQKRRVVDLPNRRYAIFASGKRQIAATTEDDDSSFIENAVTLRRHCGDVRTWAARFARSLRLDESVAKDLALAGWLHDVGKADPRFQLWLVDGSLVKQALLEEPLAKSAGSSSDRRSRDQARRRAKYPLGYRHELLSMAMIDGVKEALGEAHDRDLVLHLVASHHGWGRPFAPTSRDDSGDIDVELDHEGTRLRAGARHRLASIDSGVSDRFWTLTERYGWWGLAWLEAILRLADHRASEEETG